MEFILTGRQIREWDRYVIDKIGIPSPVLMEQAAKAVAIKILDAQEGKRVLVVCGTGNNGADGLCVYRMLKIKGFDCDCLLLGKEEKATEEFRLQKNILEHLSFPVSSPDQWKEIDYRYYDVIVDALFGVGLTRDVTGIYAEQIEKINQSGAYIYAVDIPSGISAEDGAVCGVAVKADCTVTFGYHKIGTVCYPGRQYCGMLQKADIGYPPLDETVLPHVAKAYSIEDIDRIPSRCPWGNKGNFGKILVVAGSEEYCGAVCLAVSSAYQMGAGMVKAVTHIQNRQVLCSSVPEALGLYYGEMPTQKFLEELEKSIQWADVLVVGPGLSMSSRAEEILSYFLEYHRGKPMILDADALNLISRDAEKKKKLTSNMVLTPHRMEMARLSGKTLEEIQKNPAEAAKEFALNYGCTMVLKDARTIITDGEQLYYNTSGNSGMATAGSGDVLAGILGTICSWDMPQTEAVALGVYLHGLAGDQAAKCHGQRAMKAGDIAAALEMLKDYE